jgi:hypothetical protein
MFDPRSRLKIDRIKRHASATPKMRVAPEDTSGPFLKRNVCRWIQIDSAVEFVLKVARVRAAGLEHEHFQATHQAAMGQGQTDRSRTHNANVVMNKGQLRVKDVNHLKFNWERLEKSDLCLRGHGN